MAIKQTDTANFFDETVDSINQQTVHPSGHQQSITSLLKSLSTSESNSSVASAPRKFLEDLALRSRNRFQSKKRVFIDISDGVSLLLMFLQVALWITLTLVTGLAFHGPFDDIKKDIFNILKFGPLFLLLSSSIAFLSSVILYFFTTFTIHFVSLSVLAFNLFNASSNYLNFTAGNLASLLTFLFLALYYIRGLKHLPLTCHFIKSASRLCWRNHVSLAFVFVSYTFIGFFYLITWTSSILIIQSSNLSGHFKTAALIYCVFSLMLSSAFLRDFLQIWLSRIIYNSTFAYTGRPVIVTSLTKKMSISDIENPNIPENINSNNDSSSKNAPNSPLNSIGGSYEETRRIVSRDSMWWCMGTAARSSFHLVLRAFQIHIWILSLIQTVFPNFGPPADPKCVLDVFHVPTAIYGTSYNKSRRFVEDTMVDHGMDKISVDLYLRTFIYYMISYACGVLSLLSVWLLLGDTYKFKVSFLVEATWSLLTVSHPIHFAFIFVLFGVILYFTSIDSVHMILCWSICESPTSVSALEPELMHVLVTNYHARLDLRRFCGDRIRTTKV